ncbi:hypothetical protein [Massilia genomosp. 1]|uniref:Uncharacterized protein n=1 Tax=Massilia genomosp. 1 TaxID=2609280 RepID=A0ABX0MYB4_9BURK|nr:hypothetical protein [Massilia genomosp. 1]NHZ64597.1 hypothetical protein [Massilia genomosp. 1]
MNKIDEIVSADGRFRAEFVRRDDGTYGYIAFINTNNAASPAWKQDWRADSRFESHAIALFEAKGRLAWLKKEMDWPAKDHEPMAASQYTPGWIECPFCGLRSCLLDLEITGTVHS